MSLTAAVVVCTASREREAQLRACVASLQAGDRVPDELLVVVDRNPDLEADLAASLAGVRVLRTAGAGGNSEGRNVGIRASTADVVAFVDDDAVPDPAWLAALVAAFEADPHVIGGGGRIVPHWSGDGTWLPEELLWVAGCTYAGHREDAGPIRNPIGCNMAYRRDALLAVDGFATAFGKNGSAFAICDETELCLRLAQRFGQGRIVFVPDATVIHHVSADRLRPGALARRAVSEGFSKARLRRRYAGQALAAETGYVRRLVGATLPALLARAALRRDPHALRGAAATALTLGVTAGAFALALSVPAVAERRGS